MGMKKNTIASTGRLPIFTAAVTSRKLGRTARHLVRDIVYYFFYLQFETKFKPSLRRVVDIDHPLDESIPFRPRDVKKYMFFIPLWMKSISFFHKTFGPDVNSEVDRYLDELRLLYYKAGLIYKGCSSTTRRPGLILHPTFIKIHFFDPHLHCVPSLHVGVVLFNYLKMRDLLSRFARIPGEFDSEIEYCRSEAVEIIDTILTVKQHSINCVSAGLYFVHTLYPQLSREECREIIDNLLFTAADLPGRDRIKEYTHDLFNWFLEKHDNMEEADPRGIILEFLDLYASGELNLGGV